MSDTPDLSKLFSLLSENNTSSPEEVLFNLMNSSPNNEFGNPSTSSTSSNNSKNDSNTGMPDMEMIMKLTKFMKNANEPNPSKELLMSLKPFLNDSRKERIDQYVKILGMTKAMDIFNELGDKQK